jgi:hypothetical protein
LSAQGTSTVGADWQAANLTFNWPASACARYGCMDSAADNYDSFANFTDGSCLYTGCMDSAASNYDTQANVAGNCLYTGCMDSTADNYDTQANVAGNCLYTGCMESAASNYNSIANVAGNCTYPGCTDSTASNFNTQANLNDGSCQYAGCTHSEATNYNSIAITDDGSCLNYFVSATPTLAVTQTVYDDTSTTVRLSLTLSASESTVYSIFALSNSPAMVLPPAMQFGTTGVDYGAPPVTISDGSAADNSRDSWLSVGATATAAVLSSVGINFGSWATAGLTVTDGAVLWTNPTNAPGSGAIVAQITTGCGTASSATINAQGAGVSGDDWQATSLVFSWTCV